MHNSVQPIKLRPKSKTPIKSAELARQAQAQADATKTRNTIIAIACAIACAFVAVLIMGTLIRIKRAAARQVTAINVTPAKLPTPEDLYGQCLSPCQVRKCLRDNGLNEGRFIIDLPVDGVVFEYRAVVMPDGNVMAYFAGNEKPVALEPQKLRKVAKAVWGQGRLMAVKLKPTGIRRVS